jgi:hypothetical protein
MATPAAMTMTLSTMVFSTSAFYQARNSFLIPVPPFINNITTAASSILTKASLIDKYTAYRNRDIKFSTDQPRTVTVLSRKIQGSVTVNRRPVIAHSETTQSVFTSKPEVKRRLNKFLETNLRIQIPSTTMQNPSSISHDFKPNNVASRNSEHTAIIVKHKPPRIIKRKRINLKNDTDVPPIKEGNKGQGGNPAPGGGEESNGNEESRRGFVEKDIGDGPNEFVDVATSDIAYTDVGPTNNVTATEGTEKDKGKYFKSNNTTLFC